MYAGHETTGIPKQYKLLVLVGVTRNSAGQADADMNEKNIPPYLASWDSNPSPRPSKNTNRIPKAKRDIMLQHSS
ncbi:hypothetical protein LTS03_008644 [Exophiala xenobiotica]|nr:hypothetical protein LTS03_008644 [Exophiala xenobiotica]